MSPHHPGKTQDWTGNKSQWLIAGSNSGMVGWKVDEEKVLNSDDVYTPVAVDFRMPNDKKAIVDSLDVLNDYTVVCKCVMHGFLYVVDLCKTIQELEDFDEKTTKRIEKEARILYKLDWSKTDNLYMNMGCNRQGLISCGDDQGCLWVYEQPSLKTVQDLQYNEESPAVIKANVRLMWPDLEDSHKNGNRTENYKKERYNIIVDKVAVSQDSQHIVAVTSNNMVCIWKRQKQL